MANARSLLIVSLLAFSGLATLPMTAAQAPVGGTVAFVNERLEPFFDNNNDIGVTATTGRGIDDDGDDRLEVYGTGAIIHVLLDDKDLASQATATVTVRSALETETITVRRMDTRESGTGNPANCAATATKCLFLGTFGVESSAVANNGKLAVASNSEIFLEYADAAPAATRINGPTNRLEWKTASDATISLDKTSYYGAGTGSPAMRITVIDADRNVDASVVDSIPAARLILTGHNRDIVNTVGLTEVGANSGRFEASVQFETGACNDPTKLCVTDGTVFQVAYKDAQNARGHEQTISTSASWRATYDAAVRLLLADRRTDASAIAGNADNFRGTGPNLAVAQVIDPEMAGAGSVAVRVFSSADSTGMTLTATETAPLSGEFIATFGFSTSVTGNNLLRVDPGSTVTAQFLDPRLLSGNPSAVGSATNPPRTDTAVWRNANTGIVRFINPGTAADVDSIPHNAGTTAPQQPMIPLTLPTSRSRIST